MVKAALVSTAADVVAADWRLEEEEEEEEEEEGEGERERRREVILH